ncbi:MAG: STAS domain-containing protein [Bacteroidota bacterium]
MNQFQTELSENILHVDLSGDLIGEDNGPQILEKVSSFTDQGVKYVIVNLSNVRYVNSSGIGVLITILTKFRNIGGEVYLVSPSEHVKKLLIITKLQAIFSIEESKEKAIEKIKNS